MLALPLNEIDISYEAAAELVRRMNLYWPGKYYLRWSDLWTISIPTTTISNDYTITISTVSSDEFTEVAP